MKKVIATTALAVMLPTFAFADYDYTVKSGDTMWKIAVKTQTGTQEIIDANPQIKDPNWIYPGQRLTIPTVADDVKAFEAEVIELTNQERAKYGLPALKYDWELARVARHKSEDMALRNYFSHDSPIYGSPFDMMKSYGIKYRSAGENIAKGQRSPEEVVRGWMNSPGHRQNILDREFTHIGVGYAKDGRIWTQMFIKK